MFRVLLIFCAGGADPVGRGADPERALPLLQIQDVVEEGEDDVLAQCIRHAAGRDDPHGAEAVPSTTFKPNHRFATTAPQFVDAQHYVHLVHSVPVVRGVFGVSAVNN
jgi:hypothetical protein